MSRWKISCHLRYQFTMLTRTRSLIFSSSWSFQSTFADFSQKAHFTKLNCKLHQTLKSSLLLDKKKKNLKVHSTIDKKSSFVGKNFVKSTYLVVTYTMLFSRIFSVRVKFRNFSHCESRSKFWNLFTKSIWHCHLSCSIWMFLLN